MELHFILLNWRAPLSCSNPDPPLGEVNWPLQLLVINPQRAQSSSLRSLTSGWRTGHTALFSRPRSDVFMFLLMNFDPHWFQLCFLQWHVSDAAADCCIAWILDISILHSFPCAASVSEMCATHREVFCVLKLLMKIWLGHKHTGWMTALIRGLKVNLINIVHWGYWFLI